MIKVRDSEGDYPCYICPEILNFKKDLRAHTISQHKGENNKTCPQCAYLFKDVSSVRRHIKTVHVGTKQFVCSLCQKKYMHKYDLEKHFVKNHSASLSCSDRKACPECNNVFNSTALLTEHMAAKHNKTINYIKCPFCIKIFFDPIYLKQHFKRVHGGDHSLLIICKYCPLVSGDISLFSQHMSSAHHWDDTFVCSRRDCSEYFKTEAELQDHITSHPKQTWTRKNKALHYKCGECDKQNEARETMLAHFTEQHACYPKFECKSCSTFFKAKDDMLGHPPCCKYLMYIEYVEVPIQGEEDEDTVQTTSKKRKITPVYCNGAEYDSNLGSTAGNVKPKKKIVYSTCIRPEPTSCD